TELLDVTSEYAAENSGIRLRAATDGLWMERLYENQRTCLQPREEGELRVDIAGHYHCEELDSHLYIVDAGGALYGTFAGFLGKGRMELLEPVATDLWLLPCPRALDAPAPGDWTLKIERDGAGRVSAIVVGCVLARRLIYLRLGNA